MAKKLKARQWLKARATQDQLRKHGMDQDGTVLYSGEDIELIAVVAPSGRIGLEIAAALATHPQEPEAVAGIRDLLTLFLQRNGYE